MVSVDIYRNETTRHADVILPAPSLLAKGHYDLALYQLAIRNVANYSPPVVELADRRDGRVGDHGAARGDRPGARHRRRRRRGRRHDRPHGLVDKAVTRPGSDVEGRDPDELMAAVAPPARPRAALDLMLRTGPYGDGFGAKPDGLSLAVLEANPHGIDLGPLDPADPRDAAHAERAGRARAAADRRRRRATAASRSTPARRGAGLVLVGRRDLRSNNSWMHNLEVLVKGKARCTLQVHPDDAASRSRRR